MTNIADHVARVRERIAAAAQRAGRDTATIRLVGVSKFRTLDEIRLLLSTGVRDLAENRVQEARDKFTLLANEARDNNIPPPVFHLIGHLQTNKAKYVVRLFDWVHSVDTLHVAQALADECAKQTRPSPLQVLAQVNISGESTKYGAEAGEAEILIRQIAALSPALSLRGLMTMAPYEAQPEDTRPVFRSLRLLRDRIANAAIPGITPQTFTELSMGMTNDFEVAIEEGATMLRIGTALFES